MKKNSILNKAKGTAFDKKVWAQTLKIPKGKTMSYKDIAIAIGQPRAYRAVANALGRNPLPIIIPCHRVIASDGSIGGYSARGGITQKKQLLREEKLRT